MDVVVAVHPGDRLATGLVAAVAAVADEPATVVHTAADAALALRSRGRDLFVWDPAVAAPPPAGGNTPLRIAWIASRSSAEAAKLLAAGAEDVLDGSMLAAELEARLGKVLARVRGHLVEQVAEYAGLRVDARRRFAAWQDQPLGLSPRELEVLQVLVAAEGRPVPREMVYRQVWRWAMPRGDRTVDVNVTRLRGKLTAAGVPVEIVTQPGVGYRLSVPEPVTTVTPL